MAKKNLYDADVYEEMLTRMSILTPGTQAVWGSMDVAQMLAHCSEVQDVYNGKPLDVPFWMLLARPIVRPMLLSEKPFPKNLQTIDQFQVADPEEFDTQRERLINALRTMHAFGRRDLNHKLMGRMTEAEVGWVTYRHLDHHFRQFGV
jgi:inhibitor of KinA sporulation pathway (predicted exonuclease)